MKTFLEFNLPEDSDEFLTAINGAKYKFVLDDLDNYLRAKIKYEILDDNTHDAYQSVRDKIVELLKDRDLL